MSFLTPAVTQQETSFKEVSIAARSCLTLDMPDVID
jgi:hypothetical protein